MLQLYSNRRILPLRQMIQLQSSYCFSIPPTRRKIYPEVESLYVSTHQVKFKSIYPLTSKIVRMLVYEFVLFGSFKITHHFLRNFPTLQCKNCKCNVGYRTDFCIHQAVKSESIGYKRHVLSFQIIQQTLIVTKFIVFNHV